MFRRYLAEQMALKLKSHLYLIKWRSAIVFDIATMGEDKSRVPDLYKTQRDLPSVQVPYVFIQHYDPSFYNTETITIPALEPLYSSPTEPLVDL